MSFDSSDVDSVISNWKYPLSPCDYGKTRGRGRPITSATYMNKLKLASEAANVQEKATPLGYMPTTKEVLNADINEITPLLRQLGISSHDGDISSRNTRKTVTDDRDIRLDGNVPIILNSELFAMINDHNGATTEDEHESFDPNRPLHEQFSTIKEFVPPAKEPKTVEKKSASMSSSSKTPASFHSSSSTTDTLSSHSSDAFSDTSSSSYHTTISTENDEDDWDDEIFEPLLGAQPKLFTPRQLYELKKSLTKKSDKKGYIHQQLIDIP